MPASAAMPARLYLQVIENVGTFVGITATISCSIFVHRRSLIPLYGSGPTTYLLNSTVLAAVLLSSVWPWNISLKLNLLYTAIGFSLAPNATYWIGVWTSRQRWPVLGPLLTHVAALGPLVFFLTTFVMQMSGSQKSTSGQGQKGKTERSPTTLRLVKGIATFLTAIILDVHVWSIHPMLSTVSGSQIALACAPVFYALWILSLTFIPATSNSVPAMQKAQSKGQQKANVSDIQVKSYIFLVFSFAWVMISPYLANPVLPHPLTKPYDHPSYPLRILSAEQSITGLITVAEWLPPQNPDGEEAKQQLHSARYLRASHSILGGVWMLDKVWTLDDQAPLIDSLGEQLGDSIYSAFVVQEAVRLVNSTTAGKANNWNNALIIGLGIGTSATSFIRHGISTTIVEIDPAVYGAARRYFGLPDPGIGRVFLEDARTWTTKQKALVEAGNHTTLFDIVVHDCFSGGGVPEHIFTAEFWIELKYTMEPEGILVVNFAGVLRSESSTLIINTLEQNFKQCRAFHDLIDPLTEEKYDTDFVNMVIFCTNSEAPLTFRKSRSSDWLGSPLRRHILKAIDSQEISLDLIRGVKGSDKNVLTDGNNKLGALQEEQGKHHWIVMREVLPDVHWETY